jgi:predicted DNA-binding transcriptional regulator YafY
VRRQSRLFAITEYLRGRRTGVRAEDLAARFDVTLRTIYRDLDALRDAALPLRADRGVGGGYALDRAYTLPPVNFTAREAAVLLTLGRWASEMRLLPFTGTLADGLDKVRAALDGSAQHDLLTQLKRLSFVGVPGAKVDEKIRKAVETAWFEQRALWIRYRTPDHVVSERVVRIESILFDRSHTQLHCFDETHGVQRQFFLARIERARLHG